MEGRGLMVDLPIVASPPNRVALILPGGGMRVAYQAGVVKALHEHGVRYSFADGASGGTMNLAALLGGLDPDGLCARWRTLDVGRFVSFRPLTRYLRFPNSGAFGDFDGIEAHVFPHLGIDAAKVRLATGIQASFNVCDFEDKVVVPVPQAEMSHELLLAGISLPLATPPVRYQGKWWTDAVWIRDSNLMATVRAGANELWVAWCIGNTADFKEGVLEQYVHMIEMAAIGRLNDELAEIARINERITQGERPYGHDQPIRVHIIKSETPIPLDPDFLAGKIDAETLIAYGYRDAHRYLAAMTPNGSPLTPEATKMRSPDPGVSFREVMRGRLTLGESDPERGYASAAALPLALHGTINVNDVQGFVIDPDHYGELNGHIECHRLGGWFPAARGRFGLFTPTEDRSLSYMVYAMAIRIHGKPYWLNGRKHVRIAGPWRLWGATTTLHITLHEGSDENGPVAGAGILHLGVSDLMTLLGTMQATSCTTFWQRVSSVSKFFGFFISELFRIYVFRRERK
jgi:Patatin-like phospholipase